GRTVVSKGARSKGRRRSSTLLRPPVGRGCGACAGDGAAGGTAGLQGAIVGQASDRRAGVARQRCAVPRLGELRRPGERSAPADPRAPEYHTEPTPREEEAGLTHPGCCALAIVVVVLEVRRLFASVGLGTKGDTGSRARTTHENARP